MTTIQLVIVLRRCVPFLLFFLYSVRYLFTD